MLGGDEGPTAVADCAGDLDHPGEVVAGAAAVDDAVGGAAGHGIGGGAAKGSGVAAVQQGRGEKVALERLWEGDIDLAQIVKKK